MPGEREARRRTAALKGLVLAGVRRRWLVCGLVLADEVGTDPPAFRIPAGQWSWPTPSHGPRCRATGARWRAARPPSARPRRQPPPSLDKRRQGLFEPGPIFRAEVNFVARSIKAEMTGSASPEPSRSSLIITDIFVTMTMIVWRQQSRCQTSAPDGAGRFDLSIDSECNWTVVIKNP